MQLFFVYLLKIVKSAMAKVTMPFDWFFTFCSLYMNGVKFSSFKSYGVPRVNVALGGKFKIGSGFRINNRESSNPIGRFNRCSFVVGKKGDLIIGARVGMSSIGIVCHNQIIIGDDVQIGGNVIIYDTNFHSLNPEDRLNGKTDRENTRTKPVIIKNRVFIGGHATILKGVTIGENSVIGACSLVSRDIPDNEIWAGNPAVKIKDVDQLKN